MDYRPLSDGDPFARYLRYAFAPEAGPAADDPDPSERPDPPRVRRGLYDPDAPGDDPVVVMSYYAFDAALRGTRLDVGGVATVATPPEHRRQGYVEELLRENCRELREDGLPVAALWPFEAPFYRQFGWATANHYLRWTAPPAALRSAASDRAGEWRPADPDDWPALDEVHAAASAPYELSVDRSEQWWRSRVFDSWDRTPYVYLWTDESGDPGAYVAYSVVPAGDDKSLRVHDHAAAPGREGHVYRFLADHDSQVGEVTFATAAEPTLLDRVEDPSHLTCEVEVGPMVRTVDVEATLSVLSYPAVEDRVVLGVLDPLLPELAGRYALSVADGEATCEPTEDPADAVLPVGSLSQLVVGHRSARELAAAGDLERVADAEAVARLDRLFPPAQVYLRERF